MGNNSQWAEDGFYWRRILGNNSQWAENGKQWAEDGFYWRLKTDVRESHRHYTQNANTHIDQHKKIWADTLMWAENGYKERATAITHKMATQENSTEQNPT